MKTKLIFTYLVILTGLVAISCQKGFLDKKSDKAIVVPTTYEDFQALLDNEAVMNVVPGLSVVCADEYYLTESLYNSLQTMEQKLHVWDEDPYDSSELWDWNNTYKQVLYANIVLNGIDNLDESQMKKNKLKGSALFYRAFAYYHLAQLFCPPYHESNFEKHLGLPLKVTRELDENPERSSLEETYQFIIRDIEEAIELLPIVIDNKSRPSKQAANALLAKIYLSMQKYDEAGFYANECLSYPYELLDYNLLDINALRPIPLFNQEVIYNASLISYSTIRLAIISPAVYDLFEDGDLRRKIFVRMNNQGKFNFIGTYSGGVQYFGGLAIDEALLIRAEALSRKGEIVRATEDLNELRAHRYDKTQFVPLQIGSGQELLNFILEERQRELLFRGTRWTDLRRLNYEPEFQRKLKRTVGDKEYDLEPMDLRYTLLIPTQETGFNNMVQNLR